MQPTVVPMTPRDKSLSPQQQDMIQCLEDHIIAVKAGYVQGLAVLTVSGDKFTRQMKGLQAHQACLMFSRALHKVHQEWDALPQT